MGFGILEVTGGCGGRGARVGLGEVHERMEGDTSETGE